MTSIQVKPSQSVLFLSALLLLLLLGFSYRTATLEPPWPTPPQGYRNERISYDIPPQFPDLEAVQVPEYRAGRERLPDLDVIHLTLRPREPVVLEGTFVDVPRGMGECWNVGVGFALTQDYRYAVEEGRGRGFGHFRARTNPDNRLHYRVEARAPEKPGTYYLVQQVNHCNFDEVIYDPEMPEEEVNKLPFIVDFHRLLGKVTVVEE